jgi:deoxyribonuclease-1
MKNLIVFFAIVLPLMAHAGQPAFNRYYPDDVQALIAKRELKNNDLKTMLFELLDSPHTRVEGKNDVLGCDAKKGKCFSHTAVGYGMARKYLYTQLFVTTDSRGSMLKEVYCNREVKTPINEDQINCEHTWPQSKFNKAFNNELQKSDMHHLYPSDKNANSTRGNFDFAEVVSNENLKNCEASKSGASVVSGGHTFFEPPSEHRGNVARSLFYFSVRYKMAISNEEQTFLKKWNEQDPVDDAEMARNNAIEKLQGDRNPFVDFPELAQDISKF